MRRETKNYIFNYDEIPTGYYYFAMLRGSSIQRFWHTNKFIEVANHISEGAHVLDVGCGPGSFLSILGKYKKNISATGVDIAKSQIDFANLEVAPKFPGKNINFLHIESSNDFPFPDNSFDTVTCVEVIEHIHPFLVMKMFSEIKRVLKPDGRIIITTPNYRSFWPVIEWVVDKISKVKYHEQHINRYTPGSFVKFIEAAGLELVNMNTLFITAPFVTVFSEKLAKILLPLETKINLGSLMVAELKINKNFT